MVKQKPVVRVEFALILACALAVAFLPGSNAFGSACPAANPNDNLPDSAALNACLGAGGAITLNPGTPGYIIDQPLMVTRDGTSLISSAVPAKATLIAAPGLYGPMLRVGGGAWYVSIQYLRFDGNRPNRTALSRCVGKDRTNLSNVVFYYNPHLTFSYNESTRTLCGSAVTVNGWSITVTNNYIRDNGHGRESIDANAPWADGITVTGCSGGLIAQNTVVDATDIGIVLFSSRGCNVRNNIISQLYRHAFMGIALHAVGPNDTEKQGGTVVSSNRIIGNGLLSFGLSFGMHPVYPQTTVVGGEMTGNLVRGAYVNLDVDGVKSSLAARARVGQNDLADPAGGPPHCGAWGAVNYARDTSDSQTVVTVSGWVRRDYDSCIP